MRSSSPPPNPGHPAHPARPLGPSLLGRRGRSTTPLRGGARRAGILAATFLASQASALCLGPAAGRLSALALAAGATGDAPAAAAPALEPAPLDLPRVLALHAAAMGGAGSAQRHAAVRFDLLIEENGQALFARYVADARIVAAGADAGRGATSAVSPGRARQLLPAFAARMRIDLFAGKERVFSEGYDGQAGWSWAGGSAHAEPASPDGVAALRRGIELPDKIFALHALPERGHRLRLDGFVEQDGQRFAVVELVLADGFTAEYWLDTASWLIARRRDRRAHHVDVDPRQIDIETRFEDYRRVQGIPFAHRSLEVELPSGKLLSSATVLAIELDPPPEATSFARP
jgi:hypothetical protein